MTLSEDGVFSHLVADLKRPRDVPEDGRAGITQTTYNRIRASVETEFAAKLHMAGVPVSLHEHPLLNDAAEVQLAARILRRLRTYQEVADSLFADSNVKWRLFLEAVAGVSEDGGYIDLITIEDEGLAPHQRPWLSEPNDLVGGFYSPKREY
jgi:hypothetical protein